ncbi:macrolide family glycosyltransferase [Streptomyces sp. NPDC047046]|uniref:macrolide family glycosyltransferase n=1 Tax=Streptomyces sp. NPDC047046 TaxID=3155378 RepID=UPI0033DC48E3
MPLAPAHIAMVCAPLVSHMRPSLDIVRELVARGHRVTYATGPSLAHLVEPTGAELVPVTSVLPHVDNEWPEDPIGAMGLFLDDGVQSLPQLRAAYDSDPADLYLYDIGAYHARALAEAQGRPLVQLSPAFVGWEGYAEEVGAQIKALPGADAYQERFAGWLAECGARTRDVDAFMGPPARSLALVPRAMQPHADRVNTDVVTFVGPCFDASEETWERPAGAERVLLVSLGSAYTRQPAFYRACIEAFRELSGWHVVLQIGKYVDPAELGPVPDHFEVSSWVPQRAVLAAADAFVTHAGMGGCGEALLAGVPMIAVPQAVDQFANADRLVELGIAHRVDTAEATADRLREALLALVDDPEVARRSARLREDALAEGGTSRAADLIEAELKGASDR